MQINHFNSYLSLLLLIVITFSFTIMPHGFGEYTLVKTDDGSYFRILGEVVDEVGEGRRQYVASYDADSNQQIKKRVTVAGFSETNCYCRLFLGAASSQSLECTPSQLFYRIDDCQWVAAYMLRMGDLLLCNGGQTIEVVDITLINKPLKVYMLEVKDTHTFLVTAHEIVVHNMLVPIATAISFSVPFQSGCGGASLGSILGPVGFVGGVVIGGIIGYLINACIKSTIAAYDLSFEPQAITTFIEANKNGSKEDKSKEKISQAQAPGEPTKNDGFVPKKKWDGKKVKHPVTGQVGWPDKKGNVWIPTSIGPLAHGGLHWDVVSEDARHHWNIVPGGRIRGEK